MSDIQKMYEHHVEGEVVVGTKNNKERKAFKAKFLLPLVGGEALSAIQNKLVKPYLKSTEKEFGHVRICRIVNSVVVKDPKIKPLSAKNVPNMSLSELVQFTAEQNLSADVSRMGQINEARDVVLKELAAREKAAKAKKPLKGSKVTKAMAVDNDLPDDFQV